MKYLLLIITTTVMLSCNSNKPPRYGVNKLSVIADAYFNGDFEIKNNESKTYSIVFKQYKKLNYQFADIRFFIYEHKTKTVIYEDALNQGTVNWVNDDVIVAKDRDLMKQNRKRVHKYYYNVKLKKRIKRFKS